MRERNQSAVINGHRFKISYHALDQMCQMCVDGEEVLAVLSHPDRIVSSRNYPGCQLWTLGRITLPLAVIGRGSFVVKTVLWSSAELWEADLLHGPPHPTRTFKPGRSPVRNYS